MNDNMRVEFNLVIPEGQDWSNFNLVDKPIIINNKTMGVITEAVLDDSGLWYNCKGVIWGKFIKSQLFKYYTELESKIDFNGLIIE